MPSRPFLLFLCISFLFSSCNHTPELDKEMPGTWKLSDIILSGEENEEADVLLAEALNKTLLEKGVAYYFFPDGLGGIITNGSYNPVNWKLLTEQSSIIISPYGVEDKERSLIKGTYTPLDGKHNHKQTSLIASLVSKDTLLLETFQEKKEHLYVTLNHSKLGKLEFVKSDTVLSSYKEDPFYPTNNTWRIKPEKKESEAELKARLKNFVKHYCCILKAAKERNSEIISFGDSKGIILIYNGGIGNVMQKDIPDEWIECFYDPQQAYQAHSYFDEYIKITKYEGANSGSWVNDDYNILLALYKSIDEDLNGYILN